MGRLTSLKSNLPVLGARPTARGWTDTRRTSSSSRGYGAEWQRTRPGILARDYGLCQTCRRAGILTPSNIVDHIVSREQWARDHDGDMAGCDDESNLEVICHPHHVAKTAAESHMARLAGSPILGPVR